VLVEYRRLRVSYVSAGLRGFMAGRGSNSGLVAAFGKLVVASYSVPLKYTCF